MGSKSDMHDLRCQNKCIQKQKNKENYKMFTCTLTFKGYYIDSESNPWRPEASGIYCVYAGTQTRKRLLYIGKSVDLSTRINHSREEYDEWLSMLNRGEKLYYTYAQCSEEILSDVEAALIYKHKPDCNKQSTQSYNGKNAFIICSGKISGLHSCMYVKNESAA